MSTRGVEGQRHKEQLAGVTLGVTNSDAFRRQTEDINEGGRSGGVMET